MRYLVIDDEPLRATSLVKPDNFVAIAQTPRQIYFWLKHGPWDQIFLDHDLDQGFTGKNVCGEYGIDILAFDCPIRIWSHNHRGAENMVKELQTQALRYDLPINVYVLPFGEHVNDKASP